MQYDIPRLVVGAIQGRSGKTTFTIGLLDALRRRGVRVQPFKKGPDYIDPSWATFAAGTPCRNLDAVMMPEKALLHSFCTSAREADIAVVEGAMGIFDGLDVEGSNSTAELACLLEAPVVLVVSGVRITRSVAALINGVVHFDPRIHICGVVLNQVARPRHLDIMTRSIERYCDVPILGALPKTRDIEIPDRHLGLIPAGEQDALLERIDRLGQLVEAHVDIDRLLTEARQAPPVEDTETAVVARSRAVTPRIGVFKDRAFSFYYPENLEMLELQGAEVVELDAFTCDSLDGLDGLYIGGGFPEMLAGDLVKNDRLMANVRKYSQMNMPIYAECGGLMYLSKAIEMDGERYPMAGVFDCIVRMEKKPQGHGYAIQEALTSNPFFPAGTTVKGHEFHHSRVIFDGAPPASHTFSYCTKRGKGIVALDDVIYDGLTVHQTMASYHHFHAVSTPIWSQRFVELAEAWHSSKAAVMEAIK